VLESVTLGRPEVAPFICEDGVAAVADTLRIKRNNKERDIKKNISLSAF
jgi:hypothetical protein